MIGPAGDQIQSFNLEARVAELERQLAQAYEVIENLHSKLTSSLILEPQSQTTSPPAEAGPVPFGPSDSEALQDSIFELSPVGMAILSGADLTFRRVNSAYQALTPSPETNPQGRTWREIWDASRSGIQAEGLLSYVLIHREAVCSDFHERSHPDGSTHTYSIKISPIQYEEEPAVLATILDSTEFVQSRSQAELAAAHQSALLEENLRQREFLEYLLESISDGFFALDRDWCFTYVNKRAASYNKLLTEDMLGRNLWEVWPKLLGSPIEQHYRVVMEQGVPAQFMIQGLYSSNWYEVNVYPSKDGISVFFADRTERIQYEQALQASEARFRQLADAMPQLVWTARPDGTPDYYNQRYVEFAGIDPSDDGTWDWKPVLHPDDLLPTQNLWDHAIMTGETYQIEHRVMMAGGSYRWFLSRALPAYDAEGIIVKWYGTTTDIHDQKQIEEELQDREARLERLLSAAQVGIGFVRLDGLVTGWNKSALQMLGLEEADLENRVLNWKQTFLSQWTEVDEHYLARVLEEGRLEPVERQFKRKDGTLVWMLMSAICLEDDQDEFVVFLVDISSQKAAESALQEYASRLETSNHELEQFAFIASHDMHEPLRKIEAFGRSLRASAEPKLDEQERDFLHRINKATHRMRTMINDLLDLSRVTTHAKPFIEINLRDPIQGALSDLEMRLHATKGRVELGELPSIQADPQQIRQLFQNLIGNALKFHKPGVPPLVKISSNILPSGLVEILVTDNGIGFPADYAESAFQPFRRLVGRTEYEGSGIGLAICRKIVERHGGKISAESTPGNGATFKITLPVHH